MLAPLRGRSFPLIVGSVEVLVRVRLFPLNVALDLSCCPTVWVMLFLILVSLYALNRLPPDHLECRDGFDSLNEHCAHRPILTQKWKMLAILGCLWQGFAVCSPLHTNCSGYYLLRDFVVDSTTGVTPPRTGKSLWE